MKTWESKSPLFPDILEEGPAIRATLASDSRDVDTYWEHCPADHAQTGLFLGGPEEKRPSLYHDVKTGDANRAPTHETREAALQRMDEEKNRRLRRMGLAVSGRFVRNRQRRAA